MIYSLWKKNEAYNSKVNQGESTRDIEQEATSRHGFEKTETKTEKRTQKNSADLKPALQKVINR